MKKRVMKSKSNLVFFLSFLTFLAFLPSVSPAQEQVSVLKEGAAAESDTSGNVTMDFKEADVNTVLRLLSLKSGVNIVAGPEVTGTVTVRLENVPWEQALEVVLRTYGYVYERQGNIIRVTTTEKMAQEELITETFFLEYIQLLTEEEDEGQPGASATADTGNELVEIVTTMLSERGRVKMIAQRNALVVTDTPSRVYKIGEMIRNIDHVTPQAFIDSKIVKTQLDTGENLGIRWNLASSGITAGSVRPTSFPFQTPGGIINQRSLKDQFERFFPVISGAADGTTTVVSEAIANTTDNRGFPFPAARVSGDAFTFGTLDFSQFSALLSMLQSRTNTKVVSNPRIVVLNNQTAKVQVGSEIPIPTFERNETTGSFEVTGFNYRDVGVVLNVTPHINSAKEILVDLIPEVSALGSTITYSSSLQAPSFDVTNAETQVLIRSGETIAIGGLLEDKSAVAEQQVPYLSAIPVVGKIFRSKRQTEGSSNRNVETIFFVTVTLVDTEGQPTGGIQRGHQTPVPPQETVGSQSVVNATQPPFTPAGTSTG